MLYNLVQYKSIKLLVSGKNSNRFRRKKGLAWGFLPIILF